MNRPEWFYILMGCISCAVVGIAQPALSLVLVKVIAVICLLSSFDYLTKIMIVDYLLVVDIWTMRQSWPAASSIDFQCNHDSYRSCYSDDSYFTSENEWNEIQHRMIYCMYLVLAFWYRRCEINDPYSSSNVCMSASSRSRLFRPSRKQCWRYW